VFRAVLRHVSRNAVASLAPFFARFGLAVVLATVVALGSASAASAAPLRAKFKPVPSRAVTKTISAEKGGTLTLSAPGRVRIVVRIPPRALLADTTVTATPITRFRVAPVHGGFVAGVQLAPEGLELLKAGRVEFRPRRGLRPTRRYFLGSQGTGRDVHLVPPTFRKLGRGRKAKLRVVSKPIVPILHFSTVEAFDWSKATLRDLDAIRFPQSEIDRVQQDIAVLLGIERQKQFLGFGEELSVFDLGQLLERIRDREIKPRLAVTTAALTSRCSPTAIRNGREALVLALGFVRQEQLLGLPDSFETAAALMGPLLKGVANCSLQLCSKYGPRISLFLLSFERQVGLIAGDANPGFFSVLEKNLLACSKGEVHIDSTYAQDYSSGGFTHHHTVRVVGRAPFELTNEGSNVVRWLYPEAPLEYQDVHGSNQLVQGDCGADNYRDVLSANSNGLFRINQLDFPPFDPAQPVSGGTIEKLSLAITQDPTERETIVANCGGWSGPFDGDTPTFWLFEFGGNHPAANQAIRAPSFNGPDFVPEAAPVIALAVYTQDVPGAGGTGRFTENTLVEVISKPGEMAPFPDPFG
jgi:hypothetical protein